MKIKPFLLLFMLSVFAADPVVYVPESKPIPFLWEHDRRSVSPNTFYRLYFGTNLAHVITTNELQVVSTNSDGALTLRASVSFPPTFIGPNATNLLSIAAVDPEFNPATESERNTNVIILQVLGKPLPPQALRKP